MMFGKMGATRTAVVHRIPTTLTELAAEVRSYGNARELAREALVGLEFPDTWTAENGTVYDDPLRVVDVDFMQDADGNSHLYAICQRVYATLRSIQIDFCEREIAAEATVMDGIYYYGWNVTAHDATRAYAAAECCIHDGRLYRATAAIAANTAWDASKWALQGNLVNGAISAYDGATTYALNDLCLKEDAFGSLCMHRCTTAGTGSSAVFSSLVVNTNVSQITLLSSLATGDAIPYSIYLLVFRNSLRDTTRNIIRYGYNSYGTSAYGQYLDSAAAKGYWATKKHIGQIASFGLSSYRGYKAGCSSEILSVARDVRVFYWPNYVTDGPNNASTVAYRLSTFWLPSGDQMLGNVQENEGTPFPYWTKAILDALYAGGCTVRKYGNRSGFPSTGEAGVVYFAEDTGLFFYWNSGAATPTYSVCNNDDRSNVPLAYAATKGLICSTRTHLSISDSSRVGIRCRSAYRPSSHDTWIVNDTGNLTHSNATLAYASVPCCAIR